MKDIFEQLVFLKPMLDIHSPKVQDTSTWSLFLTFCSIVTGAVNIVTGTFTFISGTVMGISVYFAITLFVIMVADLITGLMASIKEKKPKESKKGLRWAVKFIIYVAGIYVLNGLCIEASLTGLDEIAVPMQIIKFYLLIHICIWETISIDENLVRCGINLNITKFVREASSIFKQKIGVK
ncbi:MAG: hypothetical protein EOM90_19270 [Alphaproteobacteria bacterium]|nr:hypothetical protein [Alphaproteobacteria bacterium]